jgi:hypothetical protein
MNKDRIKELEERVAELRKRIPPHSVPPGLIQMLEDTEDELERARIEAQDEERCQRK